MTLYFEEEGDVKLPLECEALAKRVVEEALDYVGCPYEAEVNLLLTENAQIHEMNKEFRGIDRATDVLSFPMIDYPEPGTFDFLEEQEDCFDPESGELTLGDIVISKEKVLAQAEDIKKKQMAEAKAESGVNTDEQDEESIDIEAKPEIEFDDFMKMQFQVGEIIACEEVKKSKKLLCSQVKIGSEVKQIVSGIKKYYSAEEMVGKKVMVLVNLKPAKLAGVLSEGMLLCAEDAEGNLALMTPEKAMPAGAEIC